MPCWEEMLTMRPRASLRISCVSMRRTAARHIRKTPVAFTAMTRFHSSKLVSVRGLPERTTASLTTMSSRLRRAAAAPHGLLDVGFLRDVALEERHVQEPVRRLAAFDHLLGDVHQQQLGAFRVEFLGDAPADA